MLENSFHGLLEIEKGAENCDFIVDFWANFYFIEQSCHDIHEYGSQFHAQFSLVEFSNSSRKQITTFTP